MLYTMARPFLFALDPERAHGLALRAVRSVPALLAGRRAPPAAEPVSLIGLTFPNRVGLAAGFDKSATAVDGLGQLGFGFLEIGTVTPKAQPGNPRPRIFRLPADRALVNRMGFPNDGAEVVRDRLRSRQYKGVVGVNIGKNASTPLERAVDDYVECLRVLYPVADYIAINVSSPNTAGLRELQGVARLGPILGALIGERQTLKRTHGRRVPLLVKLSPDTAADELAAAAALIQALPLDGVIATNTTISREGLTTPNGAGEDGGLSGAPLLPSALATVERLRAILGPTFPIIGCGGIASPADAVAMRRAGADLVQVYTGLVYEGPNLVATVARALRDGDRKARTENP
jgi:dihydroorotate dehydrogenase